MTPGHPNIVFPSRRKIITIHGCFWHMHTCGRCRIPATRRSYWLAKLHRNAARDQATTRQLRHLGWRTLTLWECQIPRPRLPARLRRFLDQPPDRPVAQSSRLRCPGRPRPRACGPRQSAPYLE